MPGRWCCQDNEFATNRNRCKHMERKTKNISSVLIILGPMILGLMPIGSQLRAQSEASDPGPLDLTVSLAGSSTVSLGEPVFLKYVINNSGGEKATVYTADANHKPLITERFTDATGKPLVASVNPIPPRHSPHTMASWNGREVTGNAATTWKTVANDHVTFPRPGRYVLRVHVENGYVLGSMSDIVQGSHYVLSGDYVFPLTVVATNPAYLRATAEQLRRSVLPTLDVNARATLIQALFSMPEATASASWQTLVEEPKLDGSSLGQIGAALARIHTNRAADILAEMIWEPTQPSMALSEALPEKYLYEMYDTGDPALKKHIEDLHKQHGVEMSHFRLE